MSDLYPLTITNEIHTDSTHVYTAEDELGQYGFKLTLSRLSDKGNDLFVELTVDWVPLKDNIDPHEVYGPARYNLLSSTGARPILAYLEAAQEQYDWKTLFQQVGSKTIRSHREVEQVVTYAEWEPIEDEQPFLLAPFIAASGVSVLYGAGMVGKSTFAAVLATCVLTGEPILGHWATETGPVLWCDYETDETEVYERILALQKGMKIDDGDWKDNLHHATMHGKVVNVIDGIQTKVLDYGAKLIVLDSIGNARGGDAIGADDTLKLFKALRSLNVPVLALDHVTKEDVRAGKSATPYGSVFTINSARLLWAMVQDEDTSAPPEIRQVNLTNTKQNRIPRQPRCGVRFVTTMKKSQIMDTLSVQLNEGTWDAAGLSAVDLVLRTLREAGDEFVIAKAIVAETGLGDSTIRNVLTSLMTSQKVTSKKMGGKGGPLGYQLSQTL